MTKIQFPLGDGSSEADVSTFKDLPPVCLWTEFLGQGRAAQILGAWRKCFLVGSARTYRVRIPGDGVQELVLPQPLQRLLHALKWEVPWIPTCPLNTTRGTHGTEQGHAQLGAEDQRFSKRVVWGPRGFLRSFQGARRLKAIAPMTLSRQSPSPPQFSWGFPAPTRRAADPRALRAGGSGALKTHSF